MSDSDKALDNAVNTIEVFGKVFEVTAVAGLVLKTAGIATLGIASVLTAGVVPIVVGSVVCATALGKYGFDKLREYNNAHDTQSQPDDLMKKISHISHTEHKSPSPEEIQHALKKSGDFNVFSKVAENLTALGVVSKNKPINFVKTKELGKEKNISLPPK